MKKGYEIIKPVLDRFTGLPVRLSELFGKSAVWYRSHGYALRRDDAMANGNLSAVDHLLKFADEYEAAVPGAGFMLGELIASEFRARYNAGRAEAEEVSDRQMRLGLHKEFFEAMRELETSDLAEKSEFQLLKTDKELAEIETAVADARARVRAQMICKQKAG